MLLWCMLTAGRLLPLRLFRAIGGALGLLLYWGNARETRTARANLASCLPEMPETERLTLSRGIMAHAGMALTETFWVWGQSAQRLVQLLPVEGGELLERAREQKKGLVLLSLHGCNNDLTARWASGLMPGTWTIYSPPRTNPTMSRLLPELRAQNSGLKLAPTDRGPAALRGLYRAVRDGGAAVIWTDLDPVRGAGLYSTLFGRRALTPVLAHRLLQLPGVVPLWCWSSRTPGSFRVHFMQPADAVRDPDPAVAIAAINRDLEKVARSLGKQYFHWTYKRFRHQKAPNDTS